MNFISYLVSYFGILVSMMALDGIWLGLLMGKFYKNEFGILMRGTPVWWAAILFYIFYAAGLLILIVAPHAGEAWWHVALYAALLGFIAYMTFDLTGLAIIRAFPVKTVIVDIAWGTVASGIAGTAGYFIFNAIK
ncbi:MAG: hypothetical protein JWM20_733 [Patescibacteria group bacterium]|nr:hypothetical protein [Patescibacteria group bacterium]